jgi:hypothetical protein
MVPESDTLLKLASFAEAASRLPMVGWQVAR